MILTSDLMNPEGPVFLADGSLLVVEGTRGTVTQIMPGGQPTRIIATTGEPNGLAVDRRGTIWVADVRPPARRTISMRRAGSSMISISLKATPLRSNSARARTQ